MTSIITIVPELQRIAASSIAIAIWNHIDMPENVWHAYKDYKTLSRLCSDVAKLTNEVSHVKRVVKLINEYVLGAWEEMKSWVSYHSGILFFQSSSNYNLYCHITHFVWYPDGTIDYKKTALSLQNSIRLNDVEKYRLLCLYCFKDEIEKKWASLSSKNKVFDCADFIESPLIHYWNCYCRNELQNVPLVGDLSIDSVMFQHDEVDKWPSKEYFFDRLNIDEQIQNAISIIDKHGVRYQKLVLMKLNPSQRTKVYSSRSVVILKNYAKTASYSADVFSSWFDIKDLITEEDFVTLMVSLFQMRIDDGIVAKIWIDASDKLKRRALNYNNEDFVGKIWKCWTRYYDKDSFQMLIDMSTNIREVIKNKKIFNDHCEGLVFDDKLPILQRLLNLCFRKDEEIAIVKRNLAERESFMQHCKNLVFNNKLSTLERLLSLFSHEVDVARFKDDLVTGEFVNNHCKDLLMRGELPKLDELLNYFFSVVEEIKQRKQDLFCGVFSAEFCQRLIIEDKLSMLMKGLDFAFDDVNESARFKEALSREYFFADYCQKLIVGNELSKLDRLLNVFFPRVEESVKFKTDLKRKTFFVNYCRRLITCDELSTLNGLSNSCLFSNAEESDQFKRSLVKKKYFVNHCEKLIKESKVSNLEALCNTLFPNVEELTRFKTDLTEKKFFSNRCHSLIDLNELSTLDQLLIWSFADVNELTQFKRDLAVSKTVKNRCFDCYSTGNVNELNNLLELLFSPHRDLILEYKQNLLLSQAGFDTCVALCNSPNEYLTDMIVDCLPTSTTMMNYMKQITFSPTAISQLEQMIQKNKLTDVKKYVDRFLESDDDKKALKMQMIGNAVELLAMLFFKYDQSTCQSWMAWFLQDEEVVQECKRRLPVDEMFEIGLKKCVFHTFDQNRRVSRCTLKKDFNLESLDRFLSWYFESPKEVKEYKAQKIDSYQDIETISMLLKKGCQFSRFKILSDWFFEGDSVQVAKFKKKHRGEPIASMLNTARESYFRSRRSI